MKRFPEIARRAVSLALAASMSLSVLAPCASAAVTARDLENSVDELGNVDLTDEVFNVPDDTAAKPEIRETTEEPEFPAVEDDGVADDLTEEQLAEQAVVDEAGHTEHTPDTDAELVYEQPATCAERGYAIYPCSFTLEQEDGTVAHCYHQVVVWLPLADHEWQEPDDADSQKYRVCTVCNAVEYEDGTVVTPGGIPIVDPDQPEWLPGDGSEIATYKFDLDATLDKLKNEALNEAEKELRKQEQKIINADHPHDHVKGELVATVEATCIKEGYKEYQCNEKFQHKITVTVNNPLYKYHIGKKEYTYSKDITLTCKEKTKEPIKALEHNFPDEDDPKNWVVTKPATCEEDGVETLICTRCDGKEDGGIKTRAIPHGNVAHQWVKIDSVAATCEEEGYDLYKCSVCKTTKKEKTAEKLSHLFTNYVDDGKPACQPQSKTATCDRPGCNATDTQTSAALVPHEFTEWTVDREFLGQALYYKSTCNICHEETKRINVAEKKLDELDKALDKDPTQMSDSELTEIVALYNAAKAAISLMDKAGVNVDSYQKRLDDMKTRYDAVQHESEQRLALAAAKEAVKQAEDLINGKDPANMSNEDMAAVIAAYTAAETAVNQLDDSNAGKAELKTRLAALKKTVEQIEAKYAQKVIEDIWNKLKNGELDKSQLEAFKKVLEDLEPIIPDSLKESYEQVVDAVDAAIKAIDLVNNASALIKKLQEEIKNGNISQDTIKQLQELVKQARDLADQIKENPILKNAVDTIIKNAEKALKEAAANKALDALKEAIKNGDLSKIDEAFDQAQKAIDELRHYAPNVADKLSNALEEIKKTYIHGIKDELEKALEDGTYQEKLENLKDVIKKYEDLIKDIDASGALKDLWETIKNEQLTKLVADAVNEINRIVNDDSLSALEKIAALDELYDDLHTKLAEIVGPDKAAEMLEPFDKLIEQAKNDVAKAAAAAADTLIKEALKAIKQAVDSAESKEDAINQMETIYSQAYDLLTRSGMSAEDAASKLEPLRSAIDSLKKVLEDSFVSMDTIKAAVDVIVDAAVASDSIEDGLYKLVRTLLDGDDVDPAVKRVILVVARDILKTADWTQLTPSLLDDVVDLVVKKLDKKYGKYPFVSQLLNELKPSLNELVHREVGQETIDKVREVFFTTINNAIAGIDAGQDNRQLLAKAREDLMGLKPVVSAEMKRIGTKAGEMLNREMKDRISKALPGVVIPELIGTLVGKATEDLVNEKLGEYDEKVGAIIEKYVKYLTCPGHEYEYVTIREATCTQDGVEVKQCKNCDWQLTDDDNKIVHEKLGHVVVEDPAVDPTETEEGLTEGSHCARCGAVLEAQEVIPALQPQMDAKLVCSAIPEETVTAMRYENRKKLDAAMDAALTKAGYTAADSQRFLAQVNSSIGILPSDRYPEEGFTGYVPRPAQTAADKKYTWYAVQLLTVDAHGCNAGDVIITPVAQTDKGLQLTVYAQAVVALAWKEAK